MKVIKRGIPENYRFSCPNCKSIIGISRTEVNENRKHGIDYYVFSFICPVCDKGYWISENNLEPDKD